MDERLYRVEVPHPAPAPATTSTPPSQKDDISKSNDDILFLPFVFGSDSYVTRKKLDTSRYFKISYFLKRHKTRSNQKIR
jgi:hypothetical protein